DGPRIGFGGNGTQHVPPGFGPLSGEPLEQLSSSHISARPGTFRPFECLLSFFHRLTYRRPVIRTRGCEVRENLFGDSAVGRWLRQGGDAEDRQNRSCRKDHEKSRLRETFHAANQATSATLGQAKAA